MGWGMGRSGCCEPGWSPWSRVMRWGVWGNGVQPLLLHLWETAGAGMGREVLRPRVLRGTGSRAALGRGFKLFLAKSRNDEIKHNADAAFSSPVRAARRVRL